MSRSRERRDDEKEQRREAIIDAAELVFAAEGFDRAKIEDVAREARISRALVYVYFRNRTELSFAICLRALRALHERMRQAVAQHRLGADQVRAIGAAYIAFAHDDPLRFAALSRFETHQSDDAAEGSIEHAALQAGTAVHELTVEALRRGMRDGSIRADLEDPMLVAVTLWGYVHGVLQIAQTKASMLGNAGVQVDAFLDHGLTLAMRGLTAEPAQSPRRRT